MMVTDGEGDFSVFSWLSARTGLPWSTDLRVMGWATPDETGALALRAAVGYNTWVGDSCFGHFALEPDFRSLRFTREAFSYAFLTSGVSTVYGLTPITIPKAVETAKRLGFQEVLRTGQFVLTRIDRDNCRWIKDGWKKQRAAAS